MYDFSYTEKSNKPKNRYVDWNRRRQIAEQDYTVLTINWVHDKMSLLILNEGPMIDVQKQTNYQLNVTE